MNDHRWIARRLGPGRYLAQSGDRNEMVFVAGPPDDRWAFWSGRIFRSGVNIRPDRRPAAGRQMAQSLTAPMPATVLKVLVQAGAAVKKGETVIVLEAMKMELPLHAPGALTVVAVHCRKGDLVQPDTTLIDFA